MNVQSIVSKKLDLLAYIATHSYDIIKTFLDKNIANFEFSPPSYVVFCHDYNHHGGSSLLLVCDSIPVYRHFDLETGCEINFTASFLSIIYPFFSCRFYIDSTEHS